MVAPAKTPPKVVAALNKAAVEAMKDPAVIEKLSSQGAILVGDSPSNSAAFIDSETKKWAKVIKDAGVQTHEVSRNVRMLTTFVLRSTVTSPFGRKVRMAIDVLGLARPHQARARRSARRKRHAAPAEPARQNALPAAGRRQHDLRQRHHHRISCRMSPAPTGCCRSSGRERYHALTLSRLADGIMDASMLVVYENRFRPDAATHSPRWLAHQRGKITRGLAVFEAAPPEPDEDRYRRDRAILRARLSRLAQAGRLAAGLSAPGRVAGRRSPRTSRPSSARARPDA